MKFFAVNRLLLITIMAITLVGCAAPPAVYKPVVMSPKVKSMESVKTLAIASVKGNSGWNYNGDADLVRGKLSSFLSGVSAPGKPGFNVVDKAALDNVIKQQRLSESALFDSKTSIRLGKLIGADALINASFQISNVSDQWFTNEYTDYDTCVEYKKDGKKCKKYKKRTETCTKRSLTVELIPSVVSVTTGKNIFANEYYSQEASSKCPSKGNTLRSPGSMVNSAFSDIFAQMRKDIYFYEIVLKLKMIESDDSSMPKTSKQFLKTAMELINNNMIDRGCAQIAKAAASYNQSPAIMYNMGVCKELNGETDFAKGFFERALDYSTALSSSDKQLVYRAIRRMEGTEDLDNHNRNQRTFLDRF